jgi:thiosulfate/3-mercaptopyruvate sulfurtransferase
MHTTLIDADTVAAHLDDPRWRVVDCRFDLAAPDSGRHAWERDHIPGAVYADLERDLSGPRSGRTGRHPLPDAEAMASWLGSAGIDDGVQVVCYDADSGAFAARLWWLLRWLGHDAAAVLDGGYAAWTAAGLPVDAAAPHADPVTFRPRLRDGTLTAEAGEIHPGNPGRGLPVDARSTERFRGESEPIDAVAGHVPGARNRPFARNLEPDSGRWRPPHDLRAEWERLLGGTEPAGVVHLCGSGVTACHNLLAMEHAGLRGSRLYPGSWSEWITDPERPVATGPEEAG